MRSCWQSTGWHWQLCFARCVCGHQPAPQLTPPHSPSPHSPSPHPPSTFEEEEGLAGARAPLRWLLLLLWLQLSPPWLLLSLWQCSSSALTAEAAREREAVPEAAEEGATQLVHKEEVRWGMHSWERWRGLCWAPSSPPPPCPPPRRAGWCQHTFVLAPPPPCPPPSSSSPSLLPPPPSSSSSSSAYEGLAGAHTTLCLLLLILPLSSPPSSSFSLLLLPLLFFL